MTAPHGGDRAPSRQRRSRARGHWTAPGLPDQQGV